MIAGNVTPDLDASIRISVRDADDGLHEVTAVVDTGFNGFLTLPPAITHALRLPRIGTGRALLANGQEDLFHMYQATVLWNPKVGQEAGT